MDRRLLKIIRIVNDWKQPYFAGLLGVSRSLVEKVEGGSLPVTEHTAHRIYSLLNIDEQEIESLEHLIGNLTHKDVNSK